MRRTLDSKPMQRILTTLAMTLIVTATLNAQRATVSYRDTRGKVRDASGTVTAHTYRFLEFKAGRGRDLKIKEDDLFSLTYTRPPSVFKEAEGLFEEGDLIGALQAFEEFLAEPKPKKNEIWARENSLYYCWVISRRTGNYAAATEFEKRLKAEFRESHWWPRIELQQANDLYGRGDNSAAEAAFKALSKRATQYSPSYLFKADVGLARTLIAAKKLTKAGSMVAGLKSNAVGDGQRKLGEILEAEVEVARGEFGTAKKSFATLLQSLDYTKERAIFAAVANGLGDCAYGMGDFNQASIEYSKTMALFHNDGDVDEAVGWAFWRFANACSQLAGKAEDPELVKVYKSRHRRLRQRVAQEYRLTRGGQMARQQLGSGR